MVEADSNVPSTVQKTLHNVGHHWLADQNSFWFNFVSGITETLAPSF